MHTLTLYGIISACVTRACGIISACASQARLHSFLNTLHSCTHHITKSPRVPIHAFIVPDTILALHMHTDYTSKPYCLPNASLRTNLPACILCTGASKRSMRIPHTYIYSSLGAVTRMRQTDRHDNMTRMR